MYGQTAATNKLLARAYRSVLRRMWLKNATFTVTISAALAGLGGGANAEETRGEREVAASVTVGAGPASYPEGNDINPMHLGAAFPSFAPDLLTRGPAGHSGIAGGIEGLDGDTLERSMSDRGARPIRLGELADTALIRYAGFLRGLRAELSGDDALSSSKGGRMGTMPEFSFSFAEDSGVARNEAIVVVTPYTPGSGESDFGNDIGAGSGRSWTGSGAVPTTITGGTPASAGTSAWRSAESAPVRSFTASSRPLSGGVSAGPAASYTVRAITPSVTAPTAYRAPVAAPIATSGAHNATATNSAATTGATASSTTIEATAYGTRIPDADGSYASLHPVSLTGVFPTITPSTVSRNLGSQTGVFYYFHAADAKTMDQEMTGGMTWHTRLAQVADSVRSYYAQASGGLLDIRYTIVDVPLPAKADGTPWDTGSAQNAILPGLGVTRSDYTFVANFYGPGSAATITNPNTAAGSGGLGSVGGPTGTGQIQTWQNGTNSSAVIHELGHNMGFSHSRSVETTSATPAYTYNYTTNAYVATTGMGTATVRNLPIGNSYTEYGNPYSVMGAYPPDNSLTPRQKQSVGWMTQDNFANLNALTPAGGTNTVKIYDDMLDHTVVTNGATGDALRYGVSTGYGNITYGAYLVRPADTFHVTGTGAAATGKWQAYQQTLDFYYRSHASSYEGIDGGAPSNAAGIVVTLGGAYMGVLKVGQTFLEKDFSQSLFMPTGGGGVGAVPGYNLDDASSLNGVPVNITAYGASHPLNPNRYRSIWYQMTLVDIGSDGIGHWANLQVQSFTGAQVYGWQWDASGATAGAQDGSGTWTTGATGWRSVSMALDNQNWTAGEDAVFGSGSGTAGTVTLGGNISVNSLAFKAAGSGNYTINGSGNTLTIDVGGINTESSATLAAPVILSSQQLWSVSANQTLNVTGVITAGGNTLYKSGQGTLALGGVNTWTGQLQVGEGTVRQDANQTFNTTLRIGEAGVYLVKAGTLAIAAGVNIAGMDYGPLDGIQLASLGTLELGSTGSTSGIPDLNFLGNSTVSTLLKVNAGTHHLNGATNTVNITGIISGNGTLVKQGAGTLVLSGTNTFTGNMTLNAGGLALNSLGAVKGAPSLTVNAGSFQLGAPFIGGAATVGSLSGTGGDITTTYGTGAGIRTLAVNQSVDGTYAGTLTGEAVGSRQLALVKSGAATLTLTGANTYTGGTTVSAGTLQVGNGGSTGTLGSGAVVNNAALVFNRSDAALVVANAISGTGTLAQNGAGTTTLSGNNTYTGATTINAGTLKAGAANAFGVNSAVTLANTAGATLALNNFSQSVGSLSGGGAAGGNVTLGTATLTTGGDNTTTAYAGILSGTGGLVKTGTGTQTLSGQNTYTGTTTVAAGTLNLDFSAAGAPTTNIIAAGSALVLNGGTLAFTGKSGASNTQAFAGTTITAGASTLALIRNGATSLDVSLGAITQNSGGTINFTGATGSAVGARFLTTTGTAGALLDGGAQWAMYNGSDWASKDATNTYITAYSGYADVATNGGVIANSAAANIRITEGGAGTNTLAATTTSINSLLMSAGTTAAVVNTAGKTLIIGLANTGGIAVASGAKSLTLGAAANDGVVTVDSDSAAKTLNLISNNASAAQGLVINARIQDNASAGVVSVAVSGGAGAGTVILAGDNTYTGTTAVTNNGTLQIGNGGATGKLGAGAVSVSTGATLAFNRSDAALVVGNAISGAGALTQSGTGTTKLTGANSYSGTTTVSAGTLQVGNGGVTGSLGSGAVVDNATLAFNRSDAITVANTVSGTGALTQSGAGVTSLTGANSYSGTTTISSGTLQVGNGGVTGSLGSGAVVTNATLAFNRSDAITVANAISGSGALAQNGTGTTSLTGANSYSGTTTVSAGTLQVGNGGVTGSLGSGAVVTNATLAFNRSDAITVANAISGTGALAQNGAGTTTLTGANTYAGTTTVALGTLQVGGGGTTGSLGSGNVALDGGTIVFNRSDTITVAGAITGTGYFVQSGAGTTILTGTNTYFGQTTIASGTLQIGNGGTSGTLGNGTLVNNGTLAFNRSDNSTLYAIVSGTGGLTQAGTGTLTLAGANTYSGTTTINSGGTINVGNGGSLGSGTAAIVNNGALILSSNSGLTISGAVSGTGTLTKNGTGTLILNNAANSLTGAVTVNSGELQASAGTTAGAKTLLGTGAITVNSGATVRMKSGGTTSAMSYANDFALNNATFASEDAIVTYSGAFALTGTNTVNVVWSGKNATFANVVSGSGGLTLASSGGDGGGALILTGTNTYSGTTTVSTGTLQIGNGGVTGTLGSGAVVNNATLNFNRSDSFTVANAISGTGALVKNGAGTTTLSGSNTYSGATTINGGTIKAGAAGVLGSGSALTLANTAGVSLDLDGYNQSVGSLAGGGTTGGNITLGSAVLTTGSNNTTTAYAGILSGTGGLVKTGTGTLTLSRANTYTGSTTVAAGTLNLNFSVTGAATANILASTTTLVMNGGTLAFTGKSAATNTQAFAGTTIAAGASTLALIRNGATSLDVSLGAITQNSGGTINFTGATGSAIGARFLTTTGTANNLLDGGASWALFNGADWAAKDTTNTYIVAYSGYTDVATNGGVIPATAADIRITEGGAGTNTLAATTTSINSLLMSAATTAAVINTAGSTLVIGQANLGAIAVASGAKSLTIGAAANDGILTVGVTNAAKALTLISNNASAAQSLVINARIQDNAAGGVVSLVASGGSAAGTIILAGDNTYTGTTAVTNNGTLQIGNGGATGKLGAGAVSVSSGSTLTFNRSDAALVVGNTISGTGALTQAGTGTTSLTGANTYSGLTTVSAGTLQVGNGGSTGSLGSGAVSVLTGATLAFNRADSALTVGNIISGTGALAQTGTGTTSLTGANTYSGTTTVSAGTLQVGNGGTTGSLGSGAVVTNATLAFKRSDTVSVSNAISGTGALAQTGNGTTALTGANTYTGTTTVSAGTLQVGAGGTTGSLGSGAVVNNATLTFNRSDAALVVSNTISGAGTLAQTGAGTTTLTGTNTYTGATTINAGTLQIGSGTSGSAANTSGLVLAGGALAFGRSDAISVGTIISGAGNLTQAGAGTLTLTGANTFTGNAAVTAGSLNLANSLALQNSAITSAGTVFDSSVASHAFTVGSLSGAFGITLADNAATPAAVALSVGNNNLNTTLTGVISGAGSLIKIGTGVFSLSGTNTYTGGTFVNSGTLDLTVGGGAVGIIRGTVTVNTGGTLRLSTADATGYTAGASALSAINLVGGTLNVNTTSNQTLGSAVITMTGAKITGISGSNIDFFGGNSALVTRASTVTSTISGTQISANRQGNTTFTIEKGTTASGIDLEIASVVRNSAAGDNAGILTKAGAGTLSLSGNNTTNHAIVVSAGTLMVGSGGASGTLGSGAVTNNAALVFNRSDAFTVANTISGTGTVSHAGTGTTTLAGTNTYAGGTTVNAGTLVAGSNTAFGTGTVTVNNGGTLNTGLAGAGMTLANTITLTSGSTVSGAGTLTKALTVVAGARVSPGNSPGTLTLAAGATFAAGSVYEWQIQGAAPSVAGTDFDRIVVTGGTLAVNSGALLKVSSAGLDYTGVFWDASHAFTLVSASSAITGAFTLDTTLAGAFAGQGSWSLATSGTNVLAQWTAVPEPSTYGLLGAGALAAAALIRRRRKKAAEAV